MALINCPECGHMISDKAKACPHCGYELTKVVKPTRKKSYIIILTTILVTTIGLGAWLLSDNLMECSTESEEYQREQKTEQTNQINVIGIFDLIKTENTTWCGIVQKSPVLLSENEIIDNLKRLGFSIVNQGTQTFEGEGGDLYSAMITNLEYNNVPNYKVRVGDGTLSITFPSQEQTEAFIDDAIASGFKKSWEYDKGANYCWVFKDENGNDDFLQADITINVEGQHISVYYDVG